MELKPGIGVHQLSELEGGPFDGFVVRAYGRRPAIMLGDPRQRTLLDAPSRVLVWNARLKWYEQVEP